MVTIAKPYNDLVLKDRKIRTFDITADQDEFEWHRDRTDRTIEVLEGNGWMIQFDNELPTNINKGNKVFIPKGVFHRLFKGKDTLKISIWD